MVVTLCPCATAGELLDISLHAPTLRPQYAYSIQAGELTLPVLIGLASPEAQAHVAAGRTPLPPLWGKGAIDTGTNITCVARDILAKLGTKAVKQATSQTPTGQFVADLYIISLSIPAPGPTPGPMLTYSELTVMEMPASIPGLDALSGLDILLNCKLLLDGPAGTFTLEF